MLKAVIIDDELSAINILKMDINDYLKDSVQVIGEAQNKKDALLLIKELQPNLIFLDIDLGQDSGFDVLNELKKSPQKNNPFIIFTTAHNQFAIKAIKENAFDYLLKPIDINELINSINRLTEHLTSKSSHKSTLEQYKKESFKLEPTITLSTQEKVHICKYSDIIRCEASRNYTYFYFTKSSPILVSKNIGDYETKMAEFSFFRPHKAHLINLNYVDSYIKSDGGYILLTDGSHIPLSKNKKDAFFELLNS